VICKAIEYIHRVQSCSLKVSKIVKRLCKSLYRFLLVNALMTQLIGLCSK